MILVDSSVWIDWFRGTQTLQTQRLDELLGARELAIGDLMLAEVLQGFDDDRAFERAREALSAFPVITIGGAPIAVQAAEYHRALRRRGITARKTIDTLIAARCIHDGCALLTSDRDFGPFATHCGLVLA